MHKAAHVFGLLSLAATLLLAVGCKKEEHQLKFGHHQHVVVLELSCDTCHELAGGRMTRPKHDICVCHSDQIGGEVSEKDTACGHCHYFRKADDMVLRKVGEATPTVVFMHSALLAEKVACASCHTSIMSVSTLHTPKVDFSEKKRIMAYAHGLGLDCSTCHEGMNKDRKPASHLHGDWTKLHGREAMINGKESCTVCHDPVATCKSCHETQMPRSHNNFWRLQAHGIEASVKRDTCMVCHQTDSCEECHRNNAPLSHRAGWSSPSNRHCWNCHATVGERSGCFVCHNADLVADHPSAPQPPASLYHRPTASCLACHGPNAGSGPPPQPRPELIRRLNPAWHAILPEDTCIGCHRI